MLILALDTATESCGIGVALDDRTRVALSLHHGMTHTQSLLAGIGAVLQMARIRLEQIDAFAVTHGPGSFTGLRIGLSTAKGLALAMDKPVVGVSSLAALAHQADSAHGLICTMIDARRREVYWALFRRSHTGIIRISPDRVGPAAEAVAHIQEPCVFIGNGALAYRDLLSAQLDHPGLWCNEQNTAIRIGGVLLLAWRRLEKGQRDDVRSLAPVYLRRSDAELNFKSR